MRIVVFILFSLISLTCYAENESSVIESNVIAQDFNLDANKFILYNESREIVSSYVGTVPEKHWYDNLESSLTEAWRNGSSGVLLSGYAYHIGQYKIHVPNGRIVKQSDGSYTNELALGVGYSRSYYNKETNEEYTLFAMGFDDSFYKFQGQFGYAYQKFHYFGNSNFQYGYGYAPMMAIKPAWEWSHGIPMPDIGLMGSLRYKKAELVAMLPANLIFVFMKIDLN